MRSSTVMKRNFSSPRQATPTPPLEGGDGEDVLGHAPFEVLEADGSLGEDVLPPGPPLEFAKFSKEREVVRQEGRIGLHVPLHQARSG
jgi:hypothetical protein